MKKQTQGRLMAAQQLLLKKKQLVNQPHNYTTIIITHQKQTLTSNFFGSKNIQPAPSIKLVANNTVKISQVFCSVRKGFNIPVHESFQLFTQGKLLSDLSMTVGQLRLKYGDYGGLQMSAVCLEMF